MARIFKEEEYNTHRNEILDVVQGLFYTKGYEQTTIQDILNASQISKGAFYHYFNSKQDLLEALVNRTTAAALDVIRPIVDDPDLPAMEKFSLIFNTAAAWKTDRMDLMLSLLRAWYADDNALFRQKTIGSSLKEFAPILAEVIRQGIVEGVFSTPYHDQIGEVLLSLFQGMGDSVVSDYMVLLGEPTEAERMESYQHIVKRVAAYTTALERVLGAREGSLSLVDVDMLKVWFVSQNDSTRANG